MIQKKESLEDLQSKVDAKKDKDSSKFIIALRKMGPVSKQILNYSYPPLLYQRGDDEDDNEESEEEEEEQTSGDPKEVDFNEPRDLQYFASERDTDLFSAEKGGNATNLDGLDHDEILKVIE